MNDEKRENETTALAEVKPDNEADRAFAIVNEKGKPKTLIWSVSALVCGIVSLALSTLGWAGLILGVVAIVLAVIARVKMGYFNTYIIAALLCSIFGVVFSAASIVITAIDPEFFSRLLESVNN
ncbi:MAG: DUF4190 domain-containing protein [Clostridia bacterium]|nr:DUF4190 domain-containing protein [Clostridia bacterium]